MAATGFLMNLRDLYYPKPQIEETKNEGKVFNLQQLQGHFLILAFGMSVASVILFMEFIWLEYRNRTRHGILL